MPRAADAATRFLALLFAFAMATPLAGPAWAEDLDVDLRLFGTAQLDGFDGCSFALWQRNRDPATDKYAYVLFQPFGEDGAPLPAWMRIGKPIVSMEAVAAGGEAVGRGVSPFQVFRETDGGTLAIVDILEARETDAGTEIRDARVTVVQSGKLPFPVRVKGAAACPAQATTSQDAVSLGRPRAFEGLAGVPAAILETIDNELGDLCDPRATPGIGAVYAVSDVMSLWEIPCQLAAYHGSSVFLAAFDDNPRHNVLLPLASPPGHAGAERFALMSPTVDVSSGTVTSVAYGRGAGDCGVYERQQLIVAEGEALEFRLLELREKPDCDGRETRPQDFPLVYAR